MLFCALVIPIAGLQVGSQTVLAWLSTCASVCMCVLLRVCGCVGGGLGGWGLRNMNIPISGCRATPPSLCPPCLVPSSRCSLPTLPILPCPSLPILPILSHPLSLLHPQAEPSRVATLILVLGSFGSVVGALTACVAALVDTPGERGCCTAVEYALGMQLWVEASPAGVAA